jgi:poly-gamma-glutamate system protein
MLIVYLVFLSGFILIEQFFVQSETIQWRDQMEMAREQAIESFQSVSKEKSKRGIHSDTNSNTPYFFLIGDDYTPITTTLGSLEAKEISCNPDFAALAVRMVSEAGLQPGDKVGVTLSGSFPAIGISVLSALKTMKMDVVLFSSLGASSFGANQPAATWLDVENWLNDNGNWNINSEIVTLGAENDNGGGMQEDGIEILKQTANNHGVSLFIPGSLEESIDRKSAMLKKHKIALLINIGGNQAAVGKCRHSVQIPNGLNTKLDLCGDLDRGIIREMNAVGIPVIHFLNIKDLALTYGMDISPGRRYDPSLDLYSTHERNKWAVVLTLLTGILLLVLLLFKDESLPDQNKDEPIFQQRFKFKRFFTKQWKQLFNLKQ